jgi:LPS export ABC transporter protein LptC
MINPFKVLYLLAFVVLVFFTACENDLAKVEKIPTLEVSLPIETSKEVEIIYSDSAVVRARLTSPELKFYKVAKPYREMPKGLLVEFYAPGLILESTLKAKFGRKYENQGLVEVRDSVVVVNKKGERLDTEKLIWNEKTGKIYTDKFVRIQTNNEVIFGEGLVANQNFSSYKIFKIKGVFNLQNE